MEKVFDTLNQQRENLNRCLGCKNNTYQQILSQRGSFSLEKSIKTLAYLKTAEDILADDEYAKLCSLPKMAWLAKIIENLIHNFKYEPTFALDVDCFYMLPYDFYNFSEDVPASGLNFVLLPYSGDIDVIELIVSDVYLKNMYCPSCEDKAFIHSVEAEFIAGFYQNRCFVVRIVSDIWQNEDIMEQIHKRYDYGLFFSSFQPKHFRFIREEMFELRKRLMLWLECKQRVLLPHKLGSMSLIELYEQNPNIGISQWQQLFPFLLVKKRIFSKKLWRKMVALDMFDGVFNSMKMVLQKYDGNEDIDKADTFFYFLDDTEKVAIKIFWRQGWTAEVFVQSNLPLEFPVLTGKFVYLVKCVKNLHDEPLLENLFLGGGAIYLWNFSE